MFGGKANLAFGVGASNLQKRILLEHLSWQGGEDIDMVALHPDSRVLQDLKVAFMSSGAANIGTQTLMWECDVGSASREALEQLVANRIPWKRYTQVLISSGVKPEFCELVCLFNLFGCARSLSFVPIPLQGGNVYIFVSQGGANAGPLLTIILDSLQAHASPHKTTVNVLVLDRAADNSVGEAVSEFEACAERSQILRVVRYTKADPPKDEFREAGLLCVGLFRQVYTLEMEEGKKTMSLEIDQIDTTQ